MLIFDCRDNQLGPIGWEVILDALKKCEDLTSLNGCSQYKEILAGSLVKLKANGSDFASAYAMGQFFQRSASILTSLDIRYTPVGGNIGAYEHNHRKKCKTNVNSRMAQRPSYCLMSC